MTPCVSRYNIVGFVGELPQLPEWRYKHSCGALPSSGVILDLDHFLKYFQALVVAGGEDGSNRDPTSVLTLLPGATAWTYLASLPRSLTAAMASIVGGRLRVVSGYDNSKVRPVGHIDDGSAWRTEVMIATRMIMISLCISNMTRCLILGLPQ